MESRPTKEELQRKNILPSRPDGSVSSTSSPVLSPAVGVGQTWTSKVVVAEDWINPVRETFIHSSSRLS